MDERFSSFRIRPAGRVTGRVTRRVATRVRACLIGAFALATLSPPQSGAGEADVVEAEAVCKGEVCDFRVRVRHADEGWSHHANRWEVLGPEGELLATRVLHHPHVDEQPFTRSLRGVRVPPEVKQVRIRAGDSVHGFGGQERTIALER